MEHLKTRIGEADENLQSHGHGKKSPSKKETKATKNTISHDEFEEFSQKMKNLTSEKDILKAFSEFKAHSICHKMEFKEDAYKYVKEKLSTIHEMGMNPLFKLYSRRPWLTQTSSTTLYFTTGKTRDTWRRHTISFRRVMLVRSSRKAD